MEAVRGQDRGVLRELVLAGAAGLASMQAALDRGDLDEAARQGALAGPTVIADALRSPVRATQLAGIASAASAQRCSSRRVRRRHRTTYFPSDFATSVR